MSFNLANIRIWKIELYNTSIILSTNSGIITKLIPSDDMIDLGMILGWNVYSAFRFLVAEYDVGCFYKKDKDTDRYVKVNTDKLIRLINEPLLITD